MDRGRLADRERAMHLVENVKNIVWQNCRKLFHYFARNCKIISYNSAIQLFLHFQRNVSPTLRQRQNERHGQKELGRE